jgi:S1-C subfamily serine protease
MQRAYLHSRIKFTFVPVVIALILLSFGPAFAGDTSVHTDKGDISGITRVSVRKDGKVTIYSGSSRRIVDPTKLPLGFLASWGIDTNAVVASVAEANVNDFEKALAAGKFRIVNGVVYDLRQTQKEWFVFSAAKVVTRFSDDEVVLNTTPDTAKMTLIDALHFTEGNTYVDHGLFKFIGMHTGNAKFKTTDEKVITISAYDAGRVAEREELPDAILKDGAPNAPLVSREGAHVSPLASLPQAQQLLGMGTAFFITADGYLVTADHVVRGIHKVRVKIGTQYYDAKVIKNDQKVDLALLKIEGSSFTALPLAAKKDPDLGADVFTIGFPNPELQGFEAKYTDGKISSLSGMRDDPSRFQVTVPLQPGNSGGPLINRFGAVDGVVVGSLNDTYVFVESGSLPQNVNYAVKASILRDFLTPIHELDGKLLAQSASRKHADVMKRAQESVVMVLGYK